MIKHLPIMSFSLVRFRNASSVLISISKSSPEDETFIKTLDYAVTFIGSSVVDPDPDSHHKTMKRMDPGSK